LILTERGKFDKFETENVRKLIEKNLIKKEIVLPKMSKKEYEAAWRKFWKIGKKVSQLWKVKKTSLEILREERE
jgi:hypothetical protein